MLYRPEAHSGALMVAPGQYAPAGQLPLHPLDPRPPEFPYLEQAGEQHVFLWLVLLRKRRDPCISVVYTKHGRGVGAHSWSTFSHACATCARTHTHTPSSWAVAAAPSTTRAVLALTTAAMARKRTQPRVCSRTHMDKEKVADKMNRYP